MIAPGWRGSRAAGAVGASYVDRHVCVCGVAVRAVCEDEVGDVVEVVVGDLQWMGESYEVVTKWDEGGE